MPPKKPGKPPVLSTSKHLVPVGKRDVTTKHHGSKRDANGDKPTTARALVLRNGKYGARGTGEVMLATKMSGREKLDLLAEDLIAKSKKAMLRPFRFERCTRIAESQLVSFLEEIKSLQDPDVFRSLIIAECSARTPAQKKSGGPDPMRNASYIASIVGTRIHNAYMQASAWKIVCEALEELEDEGLDEKKVQDQLRTDQRLRERYLVLFDMVSHLVNANQAKVSVLATTTKHYAPYFKRADISDLSDSGIVFDWEAVREACKSFLDSIVIELCFPGASYPKHILYQILHDSVEESPKEAKRFPQALWNAVGDLSETVDLLEFLERPLLGPQGEEWKQQPRQMPEQYEKWVDAQLFSEKAADAYANFKDIIFPLENTKKRHVLENMWKYVNMNYQAASGMDIDTLWQLDEVLQRAPQWHSVYVPVEGSLFDADSDSPIGPGAVRKKGKPQKRLAITNGADGSSNESMPELQTVSNSSEEGTDSDDDSGDSDEEEDSDDESEYDEDYEDDMREMRREAMDIAAAIPEFFDPTKPLPDEFKNFEEERKGNPFLKLLGSLRGRMFSSNPKMKTASRTQPRHGHVATKPPPPAVPSQQYPNGGSRPTAPNTSTRTTAEVPKSRKATVEDAEDEDDASHAMKKKKKKKKTKKKKQPVAAEPEQNAPNPVIEPPVPPDPIKSSTPTHATAKVPTIPTKKPAPTTPKSPLVQARAPSINASTASLALPMEQTAAQSSHSYLQSENLANQKTKIKSRPGHSSMFSIAEKSKGFFSKFGGGKDKNKAAEEGEEKKGSKHSWFTRLGKRTKGYMHQLMNTSEDDSKGMTPMKWENFLKVMHDMGFKYDPSTAGSSVRFDPPDKRDVSITFHRPHPDPTLYPVMLKEFGKKLKRTYGWSEEDFLKQTKEK